jgi:hypothetical protein
LQALGDLMLKQIRKNLLQRGRGKRQFLRKSWSFKMTWPWSIMRSWPWRGISMTCLRDDMRHFSRRLYLSLENHQPSSSWPNFSFGASGKTSCFDSPRGRQPLSSRWDSSFGSNKKTIGIPQEGDASLVVFSCILANEKWPPEHAILINYFHQVNSISLFF